MKHQKRHGFTFIELLMSIAIVFLLISILLPSMFRGKLAANTVKCNHQLRTIYSAAVHRKMDRIDLGPDGWTYQLLPYLNNSQKIYICPEDDNPSTGSLKRVVIATNVKSYPKGQMLIPLDPNDVSGDGMKHCFRHEVVPPSNDKYELWFEDLWGGGDRDGNDVQLLIEKIDLGQIRITVIRQGSAGYTNSLIDSLTGQVLIYDASHEAGKSVIITGDGLSSYAINTYINSTWGNTNKIFALDYAGKVIAVPESDDWTRIAKFDRHYNLVNVVYSDGRTDLTNTKNIDFKNISIMKNLWVE